MRNGYVPDVNYLLRPTAGSVDGGVQLGATGAIHRTPKDLTNVLKEEAENNEKRKGNEKAIVGLGV